MCISARAPQSAVGPIQSHDHCAVVLGMHGSKPPVQRALLRADRRQVKAFPTVRSAESFPKGWWSCCRILAPKQSSGRSRCGCSPRRGGVAFPSPPQRVAGGKKQWTKVCEVLKRSPKFSRVDGPCRRTHLELNASETLLAEESGRGNGQRQRELGVPVAIICLEHAGRASRPARPHRLGAAHGESC